MRPDPFSGLATLIVGFIATYIMVRDFLAMNRTTVPIVLRMIVGVMYGVLSGIFAMTAAVGVETLYLHRDVNAVLFLKILVSFLPWLIAVAEGYIVTMTVIRKKAIPK